MIQSKKMLMQQATKYYTLTVTTNPASATCTLTYDGVAHSAKTATVKEGTVISYSVYHATYGTTTGSITMNGNKTLNCNGTYSTSTTEQSWSRPNLTSNGTMGGSSCATSGEASSSSYPAWKAFDSNSTSTGWISKTTNTGTLYFYSPTPIKVAKVYLTAYATNVNTRVAKAGTIYGSNDDSNYTSLGSWSNNTSKSWTVNLTNSTFYKYYKIRVTANTNSGYSPGFFDVDFSATTQVQSYNYYWNKSVT